MRTDANRVSCTLPRTGPINSGRGLAPRPSVPLSSKVRSMRFRAASRCRHHFVGGVCQLSTPTVIVERGVPSFTVRLERHQCSPGVHWLLDMYPKMPPAGCPLPRFAKQIQPPPAHQQVRTLRSLHAGLTVSQAFRTRTANPSTTPAWCMRSASTSHTARAWTMHIPPPTAG